MSALSYFINLKLPWTMCWKTYQ